jgi:Zn-dependent protease
VTAYHENYGSDEGGVLARLRRLFGGSDDPLRWSLPLFHFAGIAVRLHVFFLIFIVARLLASLSPNSIGVAYTALALGALFLIVLLHEFGHCFACRAVDGEAEEILMWPLGGLAFCSPPHRPMAHVVTVVGGPAVNVALLLVLAPLLYFFTNRWQAALPNIFALGNSFQAMATAGRGLWLEALWWLNVTNLILLLFNLLPMFPLDGGRLVQALLWMRLDYRRSMSIAVHTGFGAAIVLGVAALVMNDIMLLGIALFGGIVCYLEKRRLQFAQEELGFAGYDFSRGYTGLDEEDEDRDERRAEREHERRQREAAEVDRILAKVSEAGMRSLTMKERRVLRKATKRRRGR